MMIIKHSQGQIDSVYTDKEWKKVDEKQKKVGKEEKPPKKDEKKSDKKGS